MHFDPLCGGELRVHETTINEPKVNRTAKHQQTDDTVANMNEIGGGKREFGSERNKTK